MLLSLRFVAMLTVAACAAPVPPPALSVAARSRGLHPGEVVILTITADAPLTAVRAKAFDQTLPSVKVGESWRVLVGIDLDVAPGSHVVTVDADSATGAATAAHTLVVTAKDFPTRRLKVNPNFVTPPASARARIEEESRLMAALWSAPPTDARSPDLTFIAPVPHKANSAFGSRSIFNGESRGAHTGADFLSPAGTPVRAPAPGTVVLARDLYYSGGSVIIDHGLGLFSFFAHFSAITAKVGDVVQAGDVVGNVGATGRVTGPHLHWTVRLNNARVDPLALLELLKASPDLPKIFPELFE